MWLIGKPTQSQDKRQNTRDIRVMRSEGTNQNLLFRRTGQGGSTISQTCSTIEDIKILIVSFSSFLFL